MEQNDPLAMSQLSTGCESIQEREGLANPFARIEHRQATWAVQVNRPRGGKSRCSHC